MKVLIVGPAHSFSTLDVHTGLCAGLRANGIQVVEYRLDLNARAFVTMRTAAEQATGFTLHDDAFSRFLGTPALAMAYIHEPDYAIVVSGGDLHWTVPAAFKRRGLKTAVLLTESPYQLEQERAIAQQYDVVFTHEKNALTLLNHPNVHYLPHAFNPAIHKRGGVDRSLICDAFFCGTGFAERKQLFDGVDWDGLTFVRMGTLWDDADPLAADGILHNQVVAAHYRAARININQHRTSTYYQGGDHITADMAQSLGPRAYEIAACGGFQICDDSRAEAKTVFPGCLPLYKAGDSDHLSKLVRYYVARPEERRRLATQQWEAVQPHSWHTRAQQLMTILAS